MSRALSTVSRVNKALDSVVEGHAIRIPRTDMGKGAKFGEIITDEVRLFASKREPVGVRMVRDVAKDIWDNWFSVEDVDREKPDEDLDKKVQKLLSNLNSREVLTRATVFERRYGTSIIVIGYDDQDLEKGSLKTPLPFDLNKEGYLKFKVNAKIRQIETYTKTKFSVVEVWGSKEEHKKDPNYPYLFGLPKTYKIKKSGLDQTGEEVDWTRVIHFASRLDEHKYLGVSVIDAVFDDLTVFRNIRWGMGQAMYRIGGGFPDINLGEVSESKIQEYEDSGKFANLCARTYFIHSNKETLEFKGAQGVALNPQPYYEASLEQLSIGSRIPKSILRGAQAGTIAGSEVNEREYSAFISSEQSAVEPVLRELIDRLHGTGQLETDAEAYNIDWVSPFELTARDQAVIELSESISRKNQTEYKTIDEIRVSDDLPKLSDLKPAVEGGSTVLSLAKLAAQAMATFRPPQSSTTPPASEGDVIALPPDFQIVDLEDGFNKIINQVKRRDVDRSEALSQAEELVYQFVDKVEEIALRDLSAISGRAIAEPSPEAQTLKQEQTNYYLDYFKKILDDTLKGLEEPEVAT